MYLSKFCFLQEKYIVPNEGRKVVLAIVNDAWKRYKCFLKREHFTPYKTMRERLKNRPEEVPEEDFKSLLEYWRDEKTQVSNKYYCVHVYLLSQIWNVIKFYLSLNIGSKSSKCPKYSSTDI